MPQLVASALVSANVIGVATASTLVTVSNAAILVGSLHYSNRRAKRMAGEADRLARQGKGFDIRETDPIRHLIVGRASTPPERFAHVIVHGENREYVSFIACFGAHEIDAVEAILLNNEPIGSTDLDGWVNDPDSKFVKTEYRQKGEDFIWPSPGGIIELRTVNIDGKPLSLGVVEAENFTSFAEGVHYSRTDTVQTGGTVTTLTALSGSSAYAGQRVVGTFRTKHVEPLVRAKVYLGIEAGERDLWFEALPGSGWTAARHKLRGVPRVSFTLKWDSDIFGPTGFPDIRFIVRGAKCWDFVNENTTWTNSSARVAAWFLSRPEGFGIDLSTQVNSTLAAAAQNACDEAVPYGPEGEESQARYTADGLINPENSPLDNLRTILGSMAGDAAWVGGQWDIYAGVAQTPTYTLTDDDLANGEERFVADAPNDQRYNSVRGRYFGPDEPGSSVYTSQDAPPYSSATYVSADGGTRSWLEVDLPLTTDVWRAQRIQRLMLHRARNAAVWKTLYKLSAYPVRAGQWVRFRHTEYGWDELDSDQGKLFQVRERRFLPSGDVELSMVETAASIFSWNYDEAVEPDPTPNTTFPDPTYVEPLRGLEIRSDADTYDVGTDGQKIPYVLLTWDAFPPAIAAEAKRIEIEWKAASEVGYQKIIVEPDQTSLKLRPVWGGMLISGSVWVMSVLGVRSAPLFFDHRASMDLPGNVQAVSANLLMNPTFKAGVNGWTLSRESGTTDGVIFRKPLMQIIPGVPTQVRIEQSGSQNKHAVLYSELISVHGGRWYCAFSECLGTNAQTRVQVSFYRADRSWIADRYGNMVAPAPSGSSPADVTQYQYSTMFTEAPQGSAMARFTLVKFGTIAGVNSWGDFYRPFFGEVPAGSTQRPPWDPGGLPSIYTDDMEVNAATDVFTPPVPDIEIFTFGQFVVTRQLHQFTPTVSGTIEVTVTARTFIQGTGTESMLITAGLSAGSAVPDYVDVLTAPGRSASGPIEAAGGLSLSGTYQVTAGVPFVLNLTAMLRSFAVTIGVPTPIGGGFSGNCSVRNIRARITHVKR